MTASRPAAGLRDFGTLTVFRARDAAHRGVDSRALRRPVDDGVIERPGRGLYRRDDAEITGRHPSAVHGLGIRFLGRSGSPSRAAPACPPARFPVRDVPASIRRRLPNFGHARRLRFESVLQRCATERSL